MLFSWYGAKHHMLAAASHSTTTQLKATPNFTSATTDLGAMSSAPTRMKRDTRLAAATVSRTLENIQDYAVSIYALIFRTRL